VPSNTAKKKALTLATPLQFLKGLGPARAAAFARKGVITVQDALYYFPRRYEDRRGICGPKDLIGLPDGMSVSVLARIERQKEIPMRGRGTMFELVAMGEKGDLLTCTWFHTYKGMKEKFAPGPWAIFQGVLKNYRGAPQIVHPEVEILKEKPQPGKIEVPVSPHWGRVVPIYSRSDKLSQKFIRDTLSMILDEGLPLAPDLLPKDIRDRQQLPGIAESIRAMHFPTEEPRLDVAHTKDLPAAVRRLIFEEFFKFQLVLLMDRAGIKPEPSLPIRVKGHLAQKMRKNFPYSLTGAQERSIAEVLTDLQKNTAMNRIVQGDVGSGKTLVAFLTAVEVIENEGQVALMAPTEILAEQHYQSALKVFAGTEVEILLLTGSLNAAAKREAQAKIKTGNAHFVIGTHALIQEAVSWHSLRFAIIDEQHRFGVKQRTALKEKSPPGAFPHILTMTATPIPRSLALTVFGELDVSTIDEMPPGRQDIPTKIIKGADRHKLYNLIRKEAEAKHQCYIVYPLVNDSEKEGMEKLKSVESQFVELAAGELAGLRLAMVHGQMSAEERNGIMRAFKAHDYDVLVSTTVIEVGVDVPNATVMAIENAERFGLSQLHQLRGRVGRGTDKSFCVLVTDAAPPGARPLQPENSEAGVEEESPWIRLQVLEKTRSGFEIAEHDLKLRGPGDFFGTKQSGSPTFRLADLARDADLLAKAREEAQRIFKEDPKLEKPEHSALGNWFRQMIEEAAQTLKSG
jgi:ATP-dependent DNA helicase RecG